ncbi:MAG: 30S ribosomal protein S5 [Chitinophagales bacterium]|nr:30S ribosomal protein S5 [Chitinophagales bacterium]
MTNGKKNKVKASDTELKERVVSIQRVAKVTKGGRTFSFSALVVVGDGKGTIGYGLGKAREVQGAIAKGVDEAKKNLYNISLYKNTIPHEQFVRLDGAKVLVKPASEGTGVIAGGTMRHVLESAGISNVLAKSLGSNNPHNVVKATFLALSKLKDPSDFAKVRGVNLDKIFNG